MISFALRHRTTRLAACFALLLTVAACGQNDGDNSNDTSGADTGEADVEDTFVEPPTIEPKLTAQCDKCDTPVVGNVPLEVTFTLDIGDNEPADFLINWDFGDGDKLELKADQDPKELLKVAHKFKYKGVFPTRATVTWRKNLKVSKTVTQEVDVLQPSDISLSPIAVLTPTTAFPGDTVKLQFDILNDGEAVADAMETCIYLSSNDTLDDKDQKVHTLKHPDGIGSGSGGTVKISYTEAKPAEFKLPQDVADGNWFIIVHADCTGVAPELNKDDNKGFATSLLQIDTKVNLPPDLSVTVPDFDSAKSYSPGDTATYQLKIKNEGEGEAKNFEFGVFLSKDKTLSYIDDGKPDPSELENYLITKNKDLQLTDPASSKVNTLGPGTSLPIFRGVALPDVPDGTYYLIAKVDTDEEISETNETNNVMVSTVTLTVKKVTVQGVNLQLVDMWVSPKGTYLGGTVAVNWHVKNTGTLQTPDFPATVFFCPTPSLSTTTCVINKTNTTIPKLAVGQEKKGAVSIKINTQTPVQDWYVYFQLDPKNTIKELTKADNTKVWKDPPLKVTATANVQIKPVNVGYHPAKLKAGDVMKISWKVINSGSTGSTQSSTWIVMSPNNNITWANLSQLIPVKTVVEPGVEGLESAYRSATFVVPEGLSHKINTYYVGVVLDPENKEAKDNHNDNAIAAAKTVEVTDTKGGCYQDAFDLKINNDSKGNSKKLTPGTYKDLAICEDDEDWFVVEVSKGHSLFVTTTTEDILWTSPTPSDVNLDIYDPDGKPLDSVKGLGALKQAVALTVAKGGKHYIRVYPQSKGVRSHFQLQVKVDPPPAGTDLFGNGLSAGPVATFPGGLVKTKMQLTNVGATKAGPFVVRYVLSTDSTIDSSDTKLGDVVVDKGLDGATSTVVAKNLVLPVVKGGKYYIGALVDAEGKVSESDEKNNAVSSNSIQLNSTITCATDAFTGNHTVEDAAQLTPESKSYTKLNVCPGLEDWFAVKLPEGKAFNVKVNWTQKKDAGILGVQIVDSSGTGVIAGSANPLKTEATIPYLQVGGTYYIHTYVLPIGDKPPQPYDYGFDITISEPDPTDVCIADVYESNNSPTTAKELGCGLANMTLCLGDEDWFYLDLAKDELVKIKFTHDGSGFVFNIYGNPKLPPLQALNGSGTIDFKAPAAGKYYMQAVYKSPGKKPTGSFAYELKVDGGKGVDLLPTIKSLFPSKVEQGEDAYLTMNVSNECKDNAAAFHYGYYFSADNKLDASDVLMKERPISKGLLGKTNQDLDDKVQVPVGAKPGPAYVILKVDNKDEVKESQELNNTAYSALSVVKLCLADALEPNNTPTIATDIYTGTTKDLSLCPYETDWFAFEAAAGETITLTISFDQKDGDLDLRLYEVGKFSKPVAESSTKTAPEQIVFKAPKSTKYFVRVKGFTDNSNSYSLSFCKSKTGACFDCTADLHCGGKGNFCGEGGKCQELGCTLGDDSTCADGNSCTIDACVDKKGCVNTPVKAGTQCADGDQCSLGESCDAKGVCTAPAGQTVLTNEWNAGGKAGDMVLTGAGTRVYVGSVADGKGTVAGRAELYQGGELLWAMDAGEADYKVARLASAVSRSDAGQIVAVGSLAKGPAATTLPAGATPTLPAAATADAAWVVRFDGATGKVAGTHVWAPAGGAGLSAVVDSGKGGSVAVGWKHAGSNGADAWIVGFDATGKVTWEASAGGAGPDSFADVIAAPMGGWYAVGTDGDAKGGTTGLVTYIGADGKIGWSQSYAGTKGNARFWSVAPGHTGGLVAVGASEEGTADWQGWVAWLATESTATAAKLSASQGYAGSTPQDKAYKGPTRAWFTDVVVQGDGSLAVSGSTGAVTGAKGGLDAAVWLIGSDKKVAKTWTWGGNGHDVMSAVHAALGQVRAFGTTLAEQPTLSQWTEALVSPAKASCDDYNPCTTDACNAKSGCTHTPVKDGTSCGTGLTCSAGACK